MGVAPEAIVEQKLFFGYRLKYSVFHHHASTRNILAIISSGVRSALPMVVAPESKARFPVLSLKFFLLSSAICRIYLLCKYSMGLVFAEAHYYVLINKAHLARVKTLNIFLLRRIIFFFI
jgi:hypothetical protein